MTITLMMLHICHAPEARHTTLPPPPEGLLHKLYLAGRVNSPE